MALFLAQCCVIERALELVQLISLFPKHLTSCSLIGFSRPEEDKLLTVAIIIGLLHVVVIFEISG